MLTDSTRDTSPLPRLHAPIRLIPGIWAALGLIVFYFVLQLVGSFVAALALAVATGFVHAGQSLDTAIHRALEQPGMQSLLVISTLCLASIFTMLLARYRWPQLWTVAKPPGFGFARPTHLAYFVLALVIGLSVPIFGSWLTNLLAHGRPLGQNIEELGAHAPLAWRIPLALLVISLGPLVEELLFRGVLLSALMQRLNTGLAVVLTSLAFAMLHLPGFGWQWFGLPDLLLLALLLAWLRLRSASIWPGILAHSTNNLLGVIGWFVMTPHPH